MFSRYFLTLCVVAMFAFAMNVCSAEEAEVEVNAEVEDRNPVAIRAVLKLLQAGIKWAAKHCLKEAASNCQHLWKHPKQAFECGKNFLQANKGRCAVGK